MALINNRFFVFIAGTGLLTLILASVPQTAVFGQPTAHHPQTISNLNPTMATNVLVTDGSFEQAPTAWRERDNTGCLPWIGDWSTIPNHPTAYDGSNYFWAGGKCGPLGNQEDNSNSVQQNITVQPIDTMLSFWYYALREDSDSSIIDDYAYVKINTTELWRLDMVQANNTSGWVNVTLDISSFAGQTVLLKLGGVNGNFPGAGNLFFDFIEVVHNDATAPSITINKTPDTQTIAVGETAVFTIQVTNTGNVTLFQVNVTDIQTPDCNLFIGQLNAGISETYECEKLNVNDSFTNIAEVTAQDINQIQVSDSDNADVDVLNASISIIISPETQTISSGGTAAFNITVTNNGNVKLFNIAVDSPEVPDCIKTIGQLNAGSQHSYSCEQTAVFTSFLNTVSVIGKDQSQNPVSDNDDAFVDVIDSSIAIAINPEAQTVASGDDAIFNVFVFNIGDTDLTNVAVSSPEVPDCNYTIGDLQANKNTSFVCESNNVVNAFVNVATVTAYNPMANIQVADTYVAVVDMVDLNVSLDAIPSTLSAPGGTVSIDVSMINNGNKQISLTELIGTIYDAETDPETSTLLNNSCLIGQAINPNGGSYDCGFDIEISGQQGNYTFVLESAAQDNNSTPVNEVASTPIILTPAPINIVYLPAIQKSYIHSEPNNSCTTPFGISTNIPIQFLPDDIDDWYIFELDSPATLTVELTNFAPIKGQVSVWFGPCNAPTFLGHNGDFSTTKTVSLGVQPAGVYRVWIINDGSTTTNKPYTLHIIAAP